MCNRLKVSKKVLLRVYRKCQSEIAKVVETLVLPNFVAVNIRNYSRS